MKLKKVRHGNGIQQFGDIDDMDLLDSVEDDEEMIFCKYEGEWFII